MAGTDYSTFSPLDGGFRAKLQENWVEMKEK
jgi:hypothetical protein